MRHSVRLKMYRLWMYVKMGLPPPFQTVQTHIYLDMKAKLKVLPTFFQIFHSHYVHINLSRKTLPMAK